jgi:hypothetical protein
MRWTHCTPTAWSSWPATQANTSEIQILFGTDSPYDHGVSAAFTAALDADDSLTADDLAAISHRNAQALFPRLAPQPDAATPNSAGSSNSDRPGLGHTHRTPQVGSRASSRLSLERKGGG